MTIENGNVAVRGHNRRAGAARRAGIASQDADCPCRPPNQCGYYLRELLLEGHICAIWLVATYLRLNESSAHTTFPWSMTSTPHRRASPATIPRPRPESAVEGDDPFATNSVGSASLTDKRTNRSLGQTCNLTENADPAWRTALLASSVMTREASSRSSSSQSQPLRESMTK